MSTCDAHIGRLTAGGIPDVHAVEVLLALKDPEEIERLYAAADRVRKDYAGDGIFLRGLVEFSSYCRNSCLYCGLNRSNAGIERYRFSAEQILDVVGQIAAEGIKTVVLQSGEDNSLDPLWLSEVVREIRHRHDMAVTLSVGEWEEKDYRRWRDAGADRYLLKIETTDRGLYESLHPGMSYQKRLRCLEALQCLGYQTGTGIIAGLPGQTLSGMARDIVFFAEKDYDMLGIGPLIPHPGTELAGMKAGSVSLTLKAVALARIVTRRTNMPATTALGSMEKDYRLDALKCGANVLMPNFTPPSFKRLYEIYPRRRCADDAGARCVECLEGIAQSLGRYIDYGRGDAVPPGTIISKMK